MYKNKADLHRRRFSLLALLIPIIILLNSFLIYNIIENNKDESRREALAGQLEELHEVSDFRARQIDDLIAIIAEYDGVVVTEEPDGTATIILPPVPSTGTPPVVLRVPSTPTTTTTAAPPPPTTVQERPGPPAGTPSTTPTMPTLPPQAPATPGPILNLPLPEQSQQNCAVLNLLGVCI